MANGLGRGIDQLFAGLGKGIEAARERGKEVRTSMQLGQALINLNRQSPDNANFRLLAENIGLPLLSGQLTASDATKLLDIIPRVEAPPTLTPSQALQETLTSEALGRLQAGEGQVTGVGPQGVRGEFPPTPEQAAAELERITQREEAKETPRDIEKTEAEQLSRRLRQQADTLKILESSLVPSRRGFGQVRFGAPVRELAESNAAILESSLRGFDSGFIRATLTRLRNEGVISKKTADTVLRNLTGAAQRQEKTQATAGEGLVGELRGQSQKQVEARLRKEMKAENLTRTQAADIFDQVFRP